MNCQKTNDWALKQTQPHMSLLNVIERGKLKYCKHTLRIDNRLQEVIMQEKVEGKRRRVRPRRWQDDITENWNLTLESTVKLATNKNEWRKAVHEVTRS